MSIILALALVAAPAVPPVATPAASGRTLAQFQAAQRKRMMRLDTNGDGKLASTEWDAFAKARAAEGKRAPGRRFGRMDANADGFVDAAEIDAFSARRFARIDVDSDGRMVPSERPKAKARPQTDQ